MSFRQGILCQIKEYYFKINKHDSEHLILSKFYLYGAPQIMDIFKKSVLDMEFEQWQIKIKKYGLGHTIPWKYNGQDERCEK